MLKKIVLLTIILSCANVYAQSTKNQLNKNGHKEGYWEKKDAEGNIIFEGHFKDGKPQDTLYYFYPKHKIKAKMTYTPNEPLVAFISYFENGEIQSKGNYLNKKKVGLWTFYREEGVLLSKETYKDNVLNGLAEYFYFSGDKFRETIYQNGKKEGNLKEGVWKIFDENGKLLETTHYKDGLLMKKE